MISKVSLLIYPFLIFMSGFVFGAKDVQGTDPVVSAPTDDFVSAVQLFRTQAWSDAEVAFRAQITRDPSLTEYSLSYLAQIDLQNKKPKDALIKLDQALKLKPSAIFQRDLLFLEAKASLSSGKRDRALQIVQKIVKKNKRFREGLDFLATNEKSPNKKCEALTRIWKLDTTFDYPAESVCAPTFSDVKERLRKFQALGEGRIALEALKTRYEKKFTDDDWLELSAQTLISDGELGEASELLETNKEMSFSSALALGIIEGRRGEIDKALAVFDDLEKKHLNNKQKGQLIFQRAFLSYQVRHYELAAEQFKKYQKYDHGRDNRELSKWYTGWIAYLTGNYEAAKQTFFELSKNPRWNVQSLYWLAMAHFRLGEDLEAGRIFELLANSESVPGYYRILATQRLSPISQQKRIITASNENVTSKFQEVMVLPQAPHERIQLFEHEEENPLSIAEGGINLNGGDEGTSAETVGGEIPATAETEEKDVPLSIAKIRVLEKAGLEDYAQAELRRSKKAFKSSDLYLVELEKLGCYDLSTMLSRDLITQGGRRSLFDHYAYPRPFEDVVTQASSKFKISSQLIWSIMYAESRFQKQIVSPVGARGLMQLMPFTASKVSHLLGMKDFSPANLGDPKLAIQIGTRYLQKLDHEFDHQIPLMIAAYNAGPHRVQSWMYYLSTLELDEFIEHIPYSETRTYVKRVLSYVDAYSRIYKQPFEFAGLTSTPRVASEKKLVLKESWSESSVGGL